jgi:predicted DNA repair protein MutK
MFDLEDTDDVNLKRCKTDGEQLLRGRRLGEVTAEDCEAAGQKSSQKKSFWRTCLAWIASHTMQVAVGVMVGVIVAGISAYLKFS